MSAEPVNRYDANRLTTEEKNALITDPVNRGLTSREVIVRLGPNIAGGDSCVRRIRQAAGLDPRGYPAHASHHFAEAQPELAEEDDYSVDSLMRNAGNGTGTIRYAFRDRRLRLAERPSNRWPTGEHVYFIQAGEGGLIKIGCTQDLDRRYADIAAASPIPLVVIGFMRGYRPTEQHLHKLFAADRVRGEWFRPSEELLALAEGRMFLAANGTLRARTGQLGDS